MKKTIFLFLALSICISAFAQMPQMPPGMMSKKPIKAELPPPDQPLITTLSNGMEVMLVENHASPVIASVMVVKAGARYETIELNGAAHYLEHLLFNGTETRTQEQLYDEMDFLGGYNNASTRYDHTNFMILLERSNFEKGLEIQADMLFHSTLPPKKFEKEKGIILEEIGKDEDSEPYRIEQFFDRVLYPDTPYERPILGSRRSIRQMTRDQIWEYYKTYYIPSNMIALIIGDFHTPEMLKMVERIFGQEPPKELPERKISTPFRDKKHKPAEQRYSPDVTIQQGEASSHRIRLSFPAPIRQERPYFPFLVMTAMLSQHLEQELTSNPESGISATSVDHFADEDFAALNVTIEVNPEKNYEDALSELKASIERFAELPSESVKIQAMVTAIRSEEIFNAERPHYYGMLKSGDLAAAGPYFLLNYQKNLKSVTPAQVQKSKNLLNLKDARIAVYQAVDISQKTEETSKQSVTVRKELGNGLLAIVKQSSGNPIFAAHFLFKNRSACESQLGGKHGMVDFLHHALEYGPEGMGKEAFQLEFQKHGAQVKYCDLSFIPFDDYYTTPEFSYIRLEALDDDYLSVLNLVAQGLMNPNLGDDVIESVRQEMIGLAQKEIASVQEAGRALFRQSLYGDSPLAASIVGKVEDIASFSRDNMQEFAARYFSPNNLILSVVTENNADSVLAQIKGIFSSWQSSIALPQVSSKRPEFSPSRKEQEGGKEQSYLAMGAIFDLLSPKDRAPLTLMNAILSDRLQFQLREREGLAYSIGSSISFHDNWGVWAASMGTGSHNLQHAEAGIREQIHLTARERLTDHDVEKAKNAYLGRLLLRGLTRINQAYLMGLGELYGEGVNWNEDRIEELRQVTKEDIKRVVKMYMTEEELTVVIVR